MVEVQAEKCGEKATSSSAFEIGKGQIFWAIGNVCTLRLRFAPFASGLLGNFLIYLAPAISFSTFFLQLCGFGPWNL